MGHVSGIVESWWSFYLLHNIEIALFISIVLVIERALKPPARVRYILLLLGLVKICIPPIIRLPAQVENSTALEIIMNPGQILVPASFAASEWNTGLFLLLAWLLSVLLFSGKALLNYARQHRMLKNSTLGPIHISLGPGRRDRYPRVYRCRNIETPMLAGFFVQKMYVPVDFQSWPAPQRLSILAHEMTHYFNHDIRLLFIQNLILILFWINPFVWLLHSRILKVREMQCDETALRETGISPLEYSKILYSFVERQVHAAPVFVAGIRFAESRKGIQERLHHLFSLSETASSTSGLLSKFMTAAAAVLIIPLSMQKNQGLPDIVPFPRVKSASLPPERAEMNEKPASTFVAYDKTPQPAGGFKAIQSRLKYPEIARRAGIEGRAVLNVLVGNDGRIRDVRVLKSIGHSGCDEAAEEAIRATRWLPAEQKGRPVTVWVGVPVIFKLK